MDVVRERLLARLEAGWECPLTLVCAPAGYGKTTLLRQWQQRCRQEVAWLTLQASDGEPQVFLARLGEALGIPSGGVCGELDAGLATLLNVLVQRPAPLALVLDDYQRIEGSPPARALAQVIEYLPPALRLAVASRHEPPFPLPRLRVRGELAELGAGELAFTVDEAAAWAPVLPAEQAAVLVERTEGWAMAMALGVRAASPAGWELAVDRYLEHEVWAPLPPPLQRFLLAASALERPSAALCNAQIGRRAGQAMLQEAERRSLFLFPLDGDQSLYRWHPLFRAFLQRLAHGAGGA